ncbi:WD40/YVTN/BNR-like repeat-containing protein [Massilia putida]|uniref:WD40/YVTN/BNR-like repeat-containing protein n=1 Tax=Massilia putida TaxID=1141883 RepID=UPI00095169E1|nr:YCF48-related protein [Massilia putida]
MTFTFFQRGRAACLLGCMLTVLLAGSGPAEADTLSTPAKMSTRSSQSVLLAVARAGKRLVSVGERGVVLLSDDNGGSWKQAHVPVSVALTGVTFATAKKGWAVGHGGVVLHSVDGGMTWAKQLDGNQAAAAMLAAAEAGAKDAPSLSEAKRMVADGADKPFLDVYFADEQHGMIAGAYGLFFSTEDGGRSWIPRQGAIDNPRGKHLYRFHAGDRAWYLAGEQGALFRSQDRGHSWSALATPYNGTFFGVLEGANGELVAYGLRGNAWWSADQGANWTKSETGMPVTLTAGVRAGGALLLADEAGHVLRSTDGGRNFKPVPVAQAAPFTDAVIGADGALVLSGARGISLVRADTFTIGSKP